MESQYTVTNGRGTPHDPVAIIMAGGIGTRFWPVSTSNRPKQFLTLFGERSMLQMSYDRIKTMVPPARILVLTARDHTEAVHEQLPEIPPENIIGEPCRRDTAAAVALAAYLARARFGDSVMVMLTADHLIRPSERFRKVVASAAVQAKITGALYTIGIRPDRPSTAYGYLELGDLITAENAGKHFHLSRFHEKPDALTAQSYLRSGRYLWNSGMFVWTTGSIIHELEQHLPNHAALLSAAIAHDRSVAWESELGKAFQSLTSVSVDYGVMEKAADVRCIAADFYWSDVGGWNAVGEYYKPDDTQNRCRGDLLALDSTGNTVFCENQQETVALIGVHDLIVVRSGNRTLVVPKDRAQEVKKLLQDRSTDQR